MYQNGVGQQPASEGQYRAPRCRFSKEHAEHQRYCYRRQKCPKYLDSHREYFFRAFAFGDDNARDNDGYSKDQCDDFTHAKECLLCPCTLRIALVNIFCEYSGECVEVAVDHGHSGGEHGADEETDHSGHQSGEHALRHQYVGLLKIKAGQGRERYGIEIFRE